MPGETTSFSTFSCVLVVIQTCLHSLVQITTRIKSGDDASRVVRCTFGVGEPAFKQKNCALHVAL